MLLCTFPQKAILVFHTDVLYFDVGSKAEAAPDGQSKSQNEIFVDSFLFYSNQTLPSPFFFFFPIKFILGQVFRRFFNFLPQNWVFLERAGRAILLGSALSCNTTYINCKEAAANSGKAKMCRAVASGQEGGDLSSTWDPLLWAPGVSVLFLTQPKAHFGNGYSHMPWTPLGRLRCWDFSSYG